MQPPPPPPPTPPQTSASRAHMAHRPFAASGMSPALHPPPRTLQTTARQWPWRPHTCLHPSTRPPPPPPPPVHRGDIRGAGACLVRVAASALALFFAADLAGLPLSQRSRARPHAHGGRGGPGTQKSRSLCTKNSQTNISLCKISFVPTTKSGSEGGGETLSC